ncbi:maltokinase N-terminal cap-like domain-containing protein [Streptomyces beihaiensis]|uniref:Maltokinase n=1 Tax=Streptomyces beihaiensis TaxID=2984495 RepID=A0ABT3TVW6_9ACTN|nr:phosphotransferase [Streptomyces beihaiensis]MCX3061176.1 maltokinase [Streptomyces beihaiensis]
MARTDIAAAPALRPGVLSGLLRDWLPGRRWFARKEQPIADVSVLATTELYPGCLHLLVRIEHAGALPGDCYQLLLGVARRLPASRLTDAADAVVGHADGLAVYDALHDPRTATMLLESLRRPGVAGPLRFTNDASSGNSLPTGLTPRLLDVEQSNSSIVYGDALILKVFRRVQPGINPDLEVPWALARAGCRRVPAPVAWIRTTQPRNATLAVLQPYLPGASDGWTLALRALEAGRDFTAQARKIGLATAEVHQALATAFPASTAPRPSPPPHEPARLAAAMTERLNAAARCLPSLRPYAPSLRTAFDDLAARATRAAHLPWHRIHGDLHLGQVLRAGREWYLIDFEGEPSAPLAERRSAHSPVRDVAGMLRSFDYASGTRLPGHPRWAEACRDAYCVGYAEGAGWDPRAEPELLRAFETDRAVYEAVYEARHRPDWLHVPMTAIRRLATGGVHHA